MLKKVLQVLAIDDHGVVLEGYHSIFRAIVEEQTELRFIRAVDCRSAYEQILKHTAEPFEIAVIDYSIPHFAEKELYSGEDMALLIRQYMPACKIVMMTMHKEVDIIGRILEKIDPEGFVNKSDCTTQDLIDGFTCVLSGGVFYSKVISSFRKRLSKGIALDETDVQIIRLLANGVRNKSLDRYIPLSSSGIEKRKYRIKRLLDVDGDDEDLIKEARRQGYI